MDIPRFEDHPAHVDSLLEAVLAAADPGAAVLRHWPQELAGRPCRVVAAGKAAAAMVLGLVERCGAEIADGVVVGPPGVGAPLVGQGTHLEVFEADHPLATERNVLAARRVAEFVGAGAGDPGAAGGTALVVLLSGGASALLTLPAGDLTLADVRGVTGALLRAGAPIEDLNCVRKHCEVLKGGGLARLAQPVPVYALILSDVVGDRLDVIASGPTAPDPSTYTEALGVLDRCGARGACPAVAAHLEAGAGGHRPETVKAGDPALAGVVNTIVGGNAMALDAGAPRAAELGFEVAEIRVGVVGEAREVGRRLAERLRSARGKGAGATRPIAMIWGGETTVTVTGRGFGGRNQEAALGAAFGLAGEEGLVVAAFATDGVDGTAPPGSRAHAGGIVTGGTLVRALALGIQPEAVLGANDSYAFFEQVGAPIVRGPTGTNVNDVLLGLAY